MRIALFLVISATISFCGAPPPPQPGGGGIDTDGATLTENEEKLTWEEQTCIDGVKPGRKLESTQLADWSMPEGEKTKNVSLEGLITSKGLMNDVTMGGSTTARDVYQRRCHSLSLAGICLAQDGVSQGWVPHKPGVVPRFCREKGPYNRTSLEYTVLSSAYRFVKAREYLTSAYLDGDSARFKHLDLKVVPQFETLFQDSESEPFLKKFYEVNNVGYYPTFNSRDRPFIAVLPRSEDSVESTPRLWEIGFVMAHEQGHHLERVLGLDAFSKKRTLTRKAMSEAFADLVGSTFNGFESNELKNTGCLADRSIKTSTFKNGLAKVIDRDLVVSIQKSEQASSANKNISEPEHQWVLADGCASPSTTSPHGLGAILAHAFYDISAQVFSIQDLSDPDQRVKHMVSFTKSWMEIASKSVLAGNNVLSDMTMIAKAMESVLLQYAKVQKIELTDEIKRTLCQRHALHFSGLPKNANLPPEQWQPFDTWFGSTACLNQE